MYREITLHDLQVRVYRDGKTIQVLRCNGWVNLKYKESHGYPTITLKKNSLRKSYKVSRLVALAFIPNPNNLPVVMHLNNIRTDNRAENLRWVHLKKILNNVLGRVDSILTEVIINLTLVKYVESLDVLS